jgi:hypothetical protein
MGTTGEKLFNRDPSGTGNNDRQCKGRGLIRMTKGAERNTSHFGKNIESAKGISQVSDSGSNVFLFFDGGDKGGAFAAESHLGNGGRAFFLALWGRVN